MDASLSNVLVPWLNAGQARLTCGTRLPKNNDHFSCETKCQGINTKIRNY